MPENAISGVALRGIAAAVPRLREDNTTLESLADKAKKEIIERVGIRYRYVADPDTTAADLCQASANKLLIELGWKPEEIGLLVFVTQTPDHTLPGTATQLQYKLGFRQDAISLDINQGCAGYVYGMSVVAGMMRSFGIRKALLLVGDTITKLVSRSDNSIRPIFADAGSATAFELDDFAEKMHFRLGSCGKDYEAIHVPHGGYRFPTSHASLEQSVDATGMQRNLCQLSMNGQAVFTFGLSTVAAEINALLNEQGLTEKDFDHLILHQANQFLNDAIARKVGFPKAKTPSSLYDFGNTSCATIPITLVSQLAANLRSRKLSLLLCGFGVGLSWGNVALSTDKLVCSEMIHV